MSFSRSFRRLREARGLTQEEVGLKLDPPYSSTAVWKWENSGTIPRMNVLRQLAEMFGVSVGELLDENGAPAGAVSPVASGVMVPVLGTAHMEGFEAIEDVDDRVEVPSNVMAAHPGAFAIHGFGPCMNRRFPEDAYLLVDPHMEPRSGDAVLVQDDDARGLVRVWARGTSTLMLSPDSYSEEIDDIVGSPDDPPVRLVGVVVWYQAKEDVRRG